MTATALAKAQREHAEAQASHQDAEAKLQALLDRVDARRFERDAVSEKRILSHVVDPASDRQYAALTGDIDVLQRMVNEARAATKVTAAAMAETGNWLATEKADHDRQQAQAEYEMTLAKTREIEAMFCKALRAVALAGQRVGHHTLGSSFQKSDTLHRALDLNIIPLEVA